MSREIIHRSVEVERSSWWNRRTEAATQEW